MRRSRSHVAGPTYRWVLTEGGHIPVLLGEVLDLLGPCPGETAVDCTVGRGGHTMALAEQIGRTGRIIGFDLDAENAAFVKQRLKTLPTPPDIDIHHRSFADMPQCLRDSGIRADVLLADLGFSSNQMDDPSRGFGFRMNGPLDMRFDRGRGRPASALVGTLSEQELADLIFGFGEEPLSRRIARKLVQAREEASIEDTATLARLVREAYGPRARASRLHPATRTFMALRIAVNDELAALRHLLDALADELLRHAASPAEHGWINPGARVGVISFHSLEDRMVKRTFRELVRRGMAAAVTRKPVTADDAETASNPRSRSAKLRVIRIHDSGRTE